MSKSDYKYYPITGVPVGDLDLPSIGTDTEVPLRQNIDTWSKNPANEKQVKLFVLGLDRYQKISPEDRDSYFQAAGIHGKPNVPWDEPFLEQKDADNKGYCTHNNILFPIWHRAYLALYEQRIYEVMVQDIIPNFPEEEQPEWQEAAENWRLPFWDWATQTSVPDLCKYPTTLVPTADGTGEESIPNPLYQFRMPNNQPMSTQGLDNYETTWDADPQMLYFGECLATSRWPEEGDTASGTATWKYGVVNNSKVQDALKNPTWDSGDKNGQAAEMVYRLLTCPMDYPIFASTGTTAGDDQPVEKDLNLEFIHNNVHGWVGGDLNGHMSQIPVAGFDPMFWLHHCNVDRIFALWQALNPDKWFTKSTVNEFLQDAIGLPKGSVITPETPLRPFHKDEGGTLMTSADVRYPHKIGHTYPELQTWNYSPASYENTAFKADLNKTINDLYGVSRKSLLNAAKLKGVTYLEDSLKALDYSFSIRFHKFAFGGEPFWVRVYLSQDGTKQNPQSDLLTEVYNFSQKPEDEEGKLACSNCKVNKAQDIKITANISITPVLLKLLKAGKDLVSLGKDDVLKFLQTRAYWRVFKAGKEVPQYDLDPLDLEIIGATNDSTVFNDPTKAPILENFVKEPTISGGKEGALSPSLKQPVTIPPPPKPKIPKAALKVNTSKAFKDTLKADAVVLIDSTSLNLNPAKTNGIDNTQFYFTDGKNSSGNILFLLSIRRAENQIVFNTRIDDTWGEEVRVSLEGVFRSDKPSILVHDQGDGYEVFIDWKHLYWFEKRAKDKSAVSISYTVNSGQASVLSAGLNVKVYDSMKAVFNH